jgi:hypothetical protein
VDVGSVIYSCQSLRLFLDQTSFMDELLRLHFHPIFGLQYHSLFLSLLLL